MSKQQQTVHKSHSKFSRLIFRATGQTSEYRTKYGYDDDGQLASSLGYTSGGVPVAAEQLGFVYDPGWNMTNRSVNGAATAYTVNDLNQFSAGPQSPYSYDGNGNLTSYLAPYGSGSVQRTCVYDDENRLTSVYGASTYRTDFTYDGLSRMRVRTDYTWTGSAWAVSATTRYIYDGMRVVQERDGSNVPAVTYTRGKDLSGSFEGAGGIGGLLARSHGYSSGSWSTHSYYHADGNGNVTYLVNSSQAMVASYKYDPYGRTISSSGSLATANTYRFSSKESILGTSPNSGLYYFGYRFYDPLSQRWLNRDPLGEAGGINPYDFVYNNPFSYYDPDGLIGTPAENIALVLALGEDEAAEILGAAAARAAARAIAAGATGAALTGGAVVCEMSKRPARNTNRIGHRGGNDAQTHENAQGHGGREKPNFTPSQKRPPTQPPQEPSPSPGRPKFPNPGQAPKR